MSAAAKEMHLFGDSKLKFLRSFTVATLWSAAGPTAHVAGHALSHLRRSSLALLFGLLMLVSVPARNALDLSKFEGRPVAAVEVVREGVPRDAAAESELLALIALAPNTNFSAVRVRESLLALFTSGRVADARVEAFETGGGGTSAPIRLRFVVRPQVRVGDVNVEFVGVPPDDDVLSADDLRARLTLLEPGARLTAQALNNGADALQIYLRDRGFFQAEVNYEQSLNPAGTAATVTYRVTPGAQAQVEAFNINVTGFDAARVRPELALAPGAPFTRTALGEDLRRIRQAIIAGNNLAPQLNEPQVLRDPQTGRIAINLTGVAGPKINVQVTGYDISEEKEREILPVKREGSVDFSAIVEGARRLENELQEDGFFFAEVMAVCSVTSASNAAAGTSVGINPASAIPTIATASSSSSASESCQNLSARDLDNGAVTITYEVERGRRFRLTDIDIEGTNKLTYEDVAGELRSQEANALGFIPFFGLGRGYTSRELLARDLQLIRARMRDLGYRQADVQVRQGVQIDSDNLLITFDVIEGPLTRVAGVEVRGNQIYTAERLREEPCNAASQRSEPCTIIEGPYARTLARADGERIRALYARNGFVDAEVAISIVELPRKGGDEQVRIIYNVTEGGKVFINQIIINGNEGIVPGARLRTKRQAIREAIPLREGEPLKADSLAESERILYETNAFRQVIIRTEAAGETASGYRQRDVIIDLEELPPRRLDYGGGFSTDGGPLGLFEIQNSNLRGQLRQGALRARGSRQQQLLRLEFFDPRFRSYGQTKFSPLAISLQYQRDVSVTRFFRSTIDRGNFGIVQRRDEDGNPILVDCRLAPESQCEQTGEPTINRFTFNVETQRVLQERSRTILFVRYNYEDVRLFNVGSLLVAPILRPDRAVRLSRFGATLARDTRDRSFDPTRGEFLTLDAAVALRQLGGNLSFNKLQATYRRYYRFGGAASALAEVATLDRRTRLLNAVRGTVFAFGATLGAANLFNPRDRDGDGVIGDIDRTLPISERFFSGGSTTLRGFGFEEAGPRRAICPGAVSRDPVTNELRCGGGLFRNDQGDLVPVNPFLVPVGGNALAVINVEARVPLTRNFQIVPFYDGGNVFRNVGDIFGGNRNPGGDLDTRNLRAQWTHTVGLGFRFKTPLGPLALDYGFLLNPPEFELPQGASDPALIRAKRGQFHFRFGQTF
ncbi:MAG: BamA/TamA family outer membrane protein [Pyrinomonadaceae bacterium]|nr:BamA/TamA family outer membrane protein [Pyrinomonadaceae bacterium]